MIINDGRQGSLEKDALGLAGRGQCTVVRDRSGNRQAVEGRLAGYATDRRGSGIRATMCLTRTDRGSRMIRDALLLCMLG